MQSFQPQKILVESSVKDSELTKELLSRFSGVPREEVEDFGAYKNPGPMTPAKKILAIARYRGKALKPFPKISGALNLGDYVFNPVSNCHLECTYCILQSYLANNPVLTVFANLDEMLQEIGQELEAQPKKTFRVGTGELSDSLALDPLTKNSTRLIPFFAGRGNAYLELKTKSDCVENLLGLSHRGRTVISWSMSPAKVVAEEELKCASLEERIAAARRVQEAGYPVGLHLDPMIYFADWETHYEDLMTRLVDALKPEGLAWVSLGTLRFDKELKRLAGERFPHTTIFAQEFLDGPDGKMRYFKTIRLRMYRRLWQLLSEAWPHVPRYLSMEAPWVWEDLTGQAAPEPEALEAHLVKRLDAMRRSR